MEKINPADVEAQKNLDITLTVAGKKGRKTANILLMVFCLAIMFGFGISIHLKTPDDFSEQENKQLTSQIDFTAKNFAKSINSFYSDQFPFRKTFLNIKALSELSMLKMENNRVIIAGNGYIIKKLEYDNYSLAENNVAYIKQFGENLKKMGKNCHVAISPRAIDVLENYLPDSFSTDRANKIWEYIDNANIDYIRFDEVLKTASSHNEQVWFRTDHHWNSLGAYYAYSVLSEKMGFPPLPSDSLTYHEVSESFYGTTYSSLGLSFVRPDKLGLMRYENDDAFRCEIFDADTKKIMNGFYDFSYLETKDKYGIFLSGNHDRIKITSADGKIKPKLLVIKDSFANSLIPYLAYNYDLEILDLRYHSNDPSDSVCKFIEENNIDNVLILYNADTIATSDSLKLLNYGFN